jgi:Protein of unknown function (DUF732)
MRTTKAFMVVAAMATVGTLASCAQQPTPLVTPAPVMGLHNQTVIVPPNAAPSASINQQDAYFDQLMTNDGFPANLSSSQIEAHKTCAVMDQGKPPVYAIALALNDNMPPKVAGSVVYDGVLAYCPQYRGPFDQFIAGNETK